MLSNPPPLHKNRGHSGRAKAPPQTLVLVSAVYDDTVPMVFLVFDRAVDGSAFRTGQVIVNDGSLNNGVYGGIGAPGIESPTTISVVLERLGDTPAGPVTLSATSLTGVVAVDDRGTWAGLIDVGLPYDA
jgi:hypothetical protein